MRVYFVLVNALIFFHYHLAVYMYPHVKIYLLCLPPKHLCPLVTHKFYEYPRLGVNYPAVLVIKPVYM